MSTCHDTMLGIVYAREEISISYQVTGIVKEDVSRTDR